MSRLDLIPFLRSPVLAQVRSGTLLTLAASEVTAATISAYVEDLASKGARAKAHLYGIGGANALPAYGAVEVSVPGSGFSLPVARIETVSTVQVCSGNSIVLDGRASTPMDGPSLLFQWSVRPTQESVDVTDLQARLSALGGFGKGLVEVPTSSLPKHTNFYFQLHVTSHFVAEKSAMAQVLVNVVDAEHPEIRFDGPSAMDVMPTSDIFLSSSVMFPCNPAPDAVRISWSMVPLTKVALRSTSTSTVIPAGTLLPSTEYQVLVTAASVTNPVLSSTAVLKLRTLATGITALVVGGDPQRGLRTARIDTDLTIDVSAFDTLTDAPLSSLVHLWRCSFSNVDQDATPTPTAPKQKNLPCVVFTTSDTTTNKQGDSQNLDLAVATQTGALRIPAGTARPGVYTFDVVVRHGAKVSRFATRILYVNAHVANVRIASLFSGMENRFSWSDGLHVEKVVNAEDKVTIKVIVDGVGEAGMVGKWQVLDGNGFGETNLTGVAMSPVDGIAISTNSSSAYILVLPGNTLSAGTHRVRFTISGSAGDGYAEASVVINQPPAIGLLQVSPREGSAASTFVMSTAGWGTSASDTPVRFQYGFLTTASKAIHWLGPATAAQRFASELPPSTIKVLAVAVDRHGGRSVTVSANVKVSTPSVSISLSRITARMAEQMSAGNWRPTVALMVVTLTSLNSSPSVYSGDARNFRDVCSSHLKEIVQRGYIYLGDTNIEMVLDTSKTLVHGEVSRTTRINVATTLSAITDSRYHPVDSAGKTLVGEVHLHGRGLSQTSADAIVNVYGRLFVAYKFDSATDKVRSMFMDVLNKLPGILCRTVMLSEQAIRIRHGHAAITVEKTSTFDNLVNAGPTVDGQESRVLLGSELEEMYGSWQCTGNNTAHMCNGMCTGYSTFYDDITGAVFDEPSSRLATQIMRTGLFNPETGLQQPVPDLKTVKPRLYLPLSSARALETVDPASGPAGRRSRRALPLDTPEYECRYYDDVGQVWTSDGCVFYEVNDVHIGEDTVECRCAKQNVYVAGFHYRLPSLSRNMYPAAANQHHHIVTARFLPAFYRVASAWQSAFLVEFAYRMSGILDITPDRVADLVMGDIDMKTDVISSGGTLETGQGVINVEFKLMSLHANGTFGAYEAAQAFVDQVNNGSMWFNFGNATYVVGGATHHSSRLADDSVDVGLAFGLFIIFLFLIGLAVAGYYFHDAKYKGSYPINKVGPSADSKSDSPNKQTNNWTVGGEDWNKAPTLDGAGGDDMFGGGTAASSKERPRAAHHLRRTSSDDIADTLHNFTPRGDADMLHLTEPAHPILPPVDAEGRSRPSQTHSRLSAASGVLPPIAGGGESHTTEPVKDPVGMAVVAGEADPSTVPVAAASVGHGTEGTSQEPEDKDGAKAKPFPSSKDPQKPDEVGQDEQPDCVCGEPAQFACTRCRLKFYCSSTCQRTDWANHKAACKKSGTRRRKSSRASIDKAKGKMALFVPSQHKKNLQEDGTQPGTDGSAQQSAPRGLPAIKTTPAAGETPADDRPNPPPQHRPAASPRQHPQGLPQQNLGPGRPGGARPKSGVRPKSGFAPPGGQRPKSGFAPPGGQRPKSGMRPKSGRNPMTSPMRPKSGRMPGSGPGGPGGLQDRPMGQQPTMGSTGSPRPQPPKLSPPRGQPFGGEQPVGDFKPRVDASLEGSTQPADDESLGLQ